MSEDLARAQRATLLLCLAQSTAGGVAPIVIGAGGLAAYTLLGEDKSLATLPTTLFVLGSASASIPAALLMRRIGRRAGFMFGAALGVAGGLLAFYALTIQSFWLFVAVQLLPGAAAAFVQQYRFAAADASPLSFKPKAISFVLAGGVVGGIVGPQVTIHARDLISIVPFGGAFIGASVLSFLALLVIAFLDVPRPQAAKPTDAPARSVWSVITQPAFIVALLAGISSYALMSLVMTAGPLAMVHHHHTIDQASWAIQWHVIAMFAPSLFTGPLIARFGQSTVVITGLLIIAAAAGMALMGVGLFHFYTALILLGIGWNLGFVGATSMVATLYQPSEAFQVQAANEFLLFGTVAVASFSSGRVMAYGGWDVVNATVFPVIVVVLALMTLRAVLKLRNRASN